MTASTDLEREQDLFSRCLERSPDEREQVLAECTDDALRERVRRLLAHHSDTPTHDSGFLQLAGAEPEHIGPYHILSRLGEGGMGIVYATEQHDPVRRKVAVKVLRGGYRSREVLARFEAERHALALMTHPNIARILDAGTTADHRPFIAMEFVPGEPITRYCDRHALSLKARLQLFRDVCNGVQHAHQKGVIHRDLKPSNILVTAIDGQPVPKIIDFGIAKAMTQRLTDRTLETRAGSFLGTPDYMSPEQAEFSPLDVDTRADVYALGAVLYELLTGQTPLNLGGDLLHTDVQRAILERDPLPPSARVERARARELRGELDWITQKALEKDRNRRYESAAAFANDITRFLRNETPEAGPRTVTYRAGKFIRRHAFGVGVIASAFVMISAFAVAMAWQVNQTIAERDRANLEARSARDASSFLMGIFEGANPARHGQGAGYDIVQLLRDADERLDAQFAQRPHLIIEMRASIASALRGIGELELARKTALVAIEQLREFRPEPGIGIAISLSNIGQIFIDSGELATAESLIRESLGMFETIRASQTSPSARISARTGLARVLNLTGRHAEAAALHEENFHDRRAIIGDSDPRLAVDWYHAGTTYLRLNRYPDSARTLHHAAELLIAQQSETHPRLVYVWTAMMAAAGGQGRFEEAAEYARKAHELADMHYPGNGAMQAMVMNANASVLLMRNDARGAEKAARAALGLLPASDTQRPYTLGVLGVALLRLGSFDDAGRYLSESIASFDAAAGSDAAHAAFHRAGLAYAAWSGNPSPQTLAALQESVDALDPPTEFERLHFATAAAWLARALAPSDPGAAAEWREKAYAVLATIYPPGHPQRETLAGTVAPATR